MEKFFSTFRHTLRLFQRHIGAMRGGSTFEVMTGSSQLSLHVPMTDKGRCCAPCILRDTADHLHGGPFERMGVFESMSALIEVSLIWWLWLCLNSRCV